MLERIRVSATILTLLTLLALVVYDSRTHFDANLVELKRQNNSPQRSWSIFYSQNNVYQNSSIRYANDLVAIAGIIEKDSVVLSDIASSYYVAAASPAFVKNIHQHHGASRQPEWSMMLRRQSACFPDRTGQREMFLEFIQEQNLLAKRKGQPLLKYMLVNNDSLNKNLGKDCLASRNGTLNKEYTNFFPTVFRGEYLSLYRLNKVN